MAAGMTAMTGGRIDRGKAVTLGRQEARLDPFKIGVTVRALGLLCCIDKSLFVNNVVLLRAVLAVRGRGGSARDHSYTYPCSW